MPLGTQYKYPCMHSLSCIQPNLACRSAIWKAPLSLTFNHIGSVTQLLYLKTKRTHNKNPFPEFEIQIKMAANSATDSM